MLQNAGILDVQDLPVPVEDYKNRVTKPVGIAEFTEKIVIPFLLVLGYIEQHVHIIGLQQGIDGLGPISHCMKPKAPRAPVASHLDEHVLVLLFSQCGCFPEVRPDILVFVVGFRRGLTETGNRRYVTRNNTEKED